MMSTTAVDKKVLWTVIWASSVGTLIEWYDFYIFGMLAKTMGEAFFPSTSEAASLMSALAVFAAGFLVRPFGALVFGRLGDMVGRKHTFLLTLILMGGSTFLVGCIPNYATWGFFAPFSLLILRLVQGLALGGEYGGAATYVAEHAPDNQRGYYTSWIQTTATLGLFLALGVIVLVRHNLGVKAFAEWGWRIPFLISALLVAVSIYIRLKMNESPAFAKLKSEGKTAKNPLKESFGNKYNFKMVLLALFGATAGQGVVWYTGQFYAQSFLENVCKVEFEQNRNIIICALLLMTMGFVLFGALSDKIGRKGIMMAGLALAIVCYRPLFSMMKDICTPPATAIQIVSTISATAEKNQADTITTVTKFAQWNGNVMNSTISTTKFAIAPANAAQLKPLEKTNVYLSEANFWKIVGIVSILVLFVTMVYGPIAAFLVELFPTRIRYTSMSLPYHIGNGVFGGLVPFIATILTTMGKNEPDGFLWGLWYPIGVASLTLLIGLLFLSNIRFAFAKKVLGALAIPLALVVGYYLWDLTLAGKVGATADEQKVAIFTLLPVSIPILLGLIVFGWYAIKGEYAIPAEQ
jgi:MFS family permease